MATSEIVKANGSVEAGVRNRIIAAIADQQYPVAAGLLRSQGFDPKIRNDLGVCLLRCGKIDEALEVFRAFVLESGGVYERNQATDIARRNFATTLLLKGLPQGAESVLDRTVEQQHESCLRLRIVIQTWVDSLGWFHWLNWKVNRVAAPWTQIEISFVPGEFECFANEIDCPPAKCATRGKMPIPQSAHANR